MFEINPLCCRLKLPERKARRRSVSVSLLWCSGRITQIQVCGILFGIMRTEAFFLLSIYRYIYIWEVMEPRAFENCQMHFSTNQDDDDGNNDNNRTYYLVHRTLLEQ